MRVVVIYTMLFTMIFLACKKLLQHIFFKTLFFFKDYIRYIIHGLLQLIYRQTYMYETSTKNIFLHSL